MEKAKEKEGRQPSISSNTNDNLQSWLLPCLQERYFYINPNITSILNFLQKLKKHQIEENGVFFSLVYIVYLHI